MGRTKKQPPEKWENIGSSQKHTRIFNSMLESNAIKHLNGRQITLYLYMKKQYRGKETKNNPNGKQEQFYFNWHLANSKYKLYSNQETFYKDIKVLIKYGFIDCIENNRNLRQKNVYAFSDRWQKIE